MQMHGIEMIVLIKDRPIVEYQHNGQTFIEGRQGSNYAIEIRNHTPNRVQVILSVDGLSVIDGQTAGAHSRSYLIPARAPAYGGVLRVPGWLLDDQSAAKFAFAGRHNSYASQISDGQSPNVGVIGLLAYSEKPKPLPNYPFYSWNMASGLPYSAQDYSMGGMANSMNSNTSAPRGIAASAPFIGASASHDAAAAASIDRATWSINSSTASVPQPTQTLGTAFGAQTPFATHAVPFERGEQLAMMSLFYDNLKGLRAKGVVIERRGKQQQRVPEAFPGLGCTPPRGWRVAGSTSGII